MSKQSKQENRGWCHVAASIFYVQSVVVWSFVDALLQRNESDVPACINVPLSKVCFTPCGLFLCTNSRWATLSKVVWASCSRASPRAKTEFAFLAWERAFLAFRAELEIEFEKQNSEQMNKKPPSQWLRLKRALSINILWSSDLLRVIKNPVSDLFDQPRSNEGDLLMSCEGVNYSHKAVMSLTRPVKHKGAHSALSCHVKLPNTGEHFLHTGKQWNRRVERNMVSSHPVIQISSHPSY